MKVMQRVVLSCFLLVFFISFTPGLVLAESTTSAPVSDKTSKLIVGPVSIQTDTAGKVITFQKTITIKVPTQWQISERKYQNAVEVITEGKQGRLDAPEAYTMITLEQRLDHHDALQRLDQIASAYHGTTTVSAISGWPSVTIRFKAPVAKLMDRPTNPEEHFKERASDKEFALHTLTAIAAQDMVIVMDTSVAPKSDAQHVKDAEAMARAVILPIRNDAKATREELRQLKKPNSPLPKILKFPGDTDGNKVIDTATASPVLRKPFILHSFAPTQAGTSSETEAGVAANGLNMIIGSNGGTTISLDGGNTFNATNATLPFPNQGDPSVAIGRSGNFYLALLGLPGATSTTVLTGLTGCSASVMSSGNNGAIFTFAGNAALCATTGGAICFPDMEKITADRFNASRHGGDQLYATWRNFTPTIFNPASNCGLINGGDNRSMLSCSVDSGSNWTAPLVIGGGDFARLTVGQDGFVYAVIRDGQNAQIHKYTSCDQGLVELRGFPRVVMSGINNPTCPLPGLDRCDWDLTVPTVAVDDQNAQHIFVALINQDSNASRNDNVLVADSLDGGITWRSPVAINGTASARRFMPWLCTSSGNAYVGWYDRRAASAPGAASNDLTDYFIGSATLRNGQLLADGELNLTGNPDPQCASGWFGGAGSPRNSNDSEGCSVQPQLAGSCQNSAGTGSNARCDFSSGPACPSGESCKTGGGGPKYGDYNGIACNSDRVLATWASATIPTGFIGAAAAGIQVWADVEKVNGNLSVQVKNIPSIDPGKFNVSLNGSVIASTVSNTTIGPITLPVTSTQQISETASTGTTGANYTVSIGGDCEANGTVHFSVLHPATCTITNVNRDYRACTITCSIEEGQCMKVAHGSGERQLCIRERKQCDSVCASPQLIVENHIVPGIDPGRFNLLIDGTVRLANAGNSATTQSIKLPTGIHTVSVTAGSGTNSGNYTTVISGDCATTGVVTLGYGDQKDCIITSSRNPGTGAEGQITVNKIMNPALDPSLFNLLIDGTVRATNVSNGGTTGPVTVFEGEYVVSETASSTNQSNYIATFSGDCDVQGKVLVAPAEHKVCTITNRLNNKACLDACKADLQQCMADAHSGTARGVCVRENKMCVQDCH